MARSVRLTAVGAHGKAGAVWVGLCALLATAALAAQRVPSEVLDWQPALAATEPWRWWSAALVHRSALHLLANLAGCAVVGAFGWLAYTPTRLAVAWAASWPLTHLALLLRPDLASYGGLSGVLHGGVAVVSMHLMLGPLRRTRLIGVAVLTGLAVKLLLEEPWGPALLYRPGWDIAIAPLAHTTGVVSAIFFTAVVMAMARSLPQR